MDTTTRINSILARIAELKAKDTELSNFGAGDNPYYGITGHHYTLHPPLSEEEIAAAEKKIDVPLPEEYRAFLKLAGNGGAGPAWGLFTLENTYPGDEMLNEYPDFCSMEFPYEDSYAEGAYAVLSKDFHHRGPFDEPFGGYVQLANYGHDMTAILIVSGQQRGKLWMMEQGVSLTPFVQQRDGKTTGVGFLDWYDNWLNEYLVPGSQPSQF